MPRGEYLVVAHDSVGTAEFDRSHDLPIIRMPLDLESWGMVGWRGGNAYLNLFRRLNCIADEHEITAIHAACVLPEGFLAWMLGRRLGLPYVVYVHGEELNIVRQSRELTWMARRVFGNASRIITNSYNTADILQSAWPVSREQISVLHPGVDTGKYRPAPRDAAIRRRLGWDDRRVVLTVGRLQARKGQDQFIRAIPALRQSIPDVLYSIVGDGRERDSLSQLIQELKLESHVKLEGELHDDDLIAAYQQCDLFALPNREERGDFEGFGIVLLEAQACGKPVLTGDSGGTREAIKPTETGALIDCTLPSHIAIETIRLLSDPRRMSSMGANGRQWTCRAFDWMVCAEQAQQVFELTQPQSKLPASQEN